jgi:hypothetical protein
MSVAQTVQSFAGIANENEFYGHHYLAEVFKGDIRTLIESWQATEDAAGKATATVLPRKKPVATHPAVRAHLTNAWVAWA